MILTLENWVFFANKIFFCTPVLYIIDHYNYLTKEVKKTNQKVVKQMINPKVKERICHDFYPNCTYCTCFSMCFPKNPAEDVASQFLLKEENWRIKESQVAFDVASIQNP